MALKKGVLISSLGESPAVVTETVDALEREGVEIGLVVTIGTSDWKVELSEDVLSNEFKNYYGEQISYYPYRTKAQDLIEQADHIEFLREVAFQIRYYRSFANVYLSLAGGRKTMSAAMTIAAQIYGARALFHIIPLDKEIEELGNIEKLIKLPSEIQKEILHPPADRIKLVRLPIISLMPLLDDFLRVLKGEGTANQEAIDLLRESGMIDESLQPSPTGKILLEILEDVERLPPPSNLPPERRKVVIHDHGYGGKRDKVEKFAEKLKLFPWTIEVKTIPYKKSTKTGIRSVHDDGRIEVDLNLETFSAGLEIKTTARNKGETERLAKELKHFVSKLT